MIELKAFVKRNSKMFFYDKGVFLTSLITPVILLVLYVTFLGKIYKESFLTAIPKGFAVSDGIINGLVGGELISSLLAVSCVTVAFCANMIMVSDKANGVANDFKITPVKSGIFALGYYIGTLKSTMIVSFFATAAGLVYLSFTGWYLSALDIIFILIDVFVLVMFGTALSSIINVFLSSQGQISAVGTIVSSGYGFICGAYMPISNFNKGLQKIISFLPGTYGTSLLRNHFLNGVLEKMETDGTPSEIIEKIMDSVDCNIYFFENKVDLGSMYLIMILSIFVLLIIYILLNNIKRKKSI